MWPRWDRFSLSNSSSQSTTSTLVVVVTTTAATAVVAGTAWVLWRQSRNRRTPGTSSVVARCVVITGCDSGFGADLLRRVITEGASSEEGVEYTVVAACYTAAAVEALQATYPVERVVPVQADLTTLEGVDRVVQVSRETCQQERFSGTLYALVNNAGISTSGHVYWTPPESYRTLMELNLFAPVALTYHLLPLLKKYNEVHCLYAGKAARMARQKLGTDHSKPSRIINVGSVAGFFCIPTIAAYNATKHAVEGWSDTLRLELVPWNVQVALIEPGIMNTPMAQDASASFARNFHRADPARQEEFGPDLFELYYTIMDKFVKWTGSDPVITVKDIFRALTVSYPRTRTLSGWAAKWVYKPMSWVPDRWRDQIIIAPLFSGLLVPKTEKKTT